MMFNIIEKTGWTKQHLLWGESWINIRLMLSDAPGIKSGKVPDTPQATKLDDNGVKDFFSTWKPSSL